MDELDAPGWSIRNKDLLLPTGPVVHSTATPKVPLNTRSAKPCDIHCAEPIPTTPESCEEEQEQLRVLIDKQWANIQNLDNQIKDKIYGEGDDTTNMLSVKIYTM